MKKILWLSPYAPYDRVAHAGGKVHNYYLKQFHKSGLFDITLLSLCDQSEAPKLDLDAYGIKNRIHVAEKNKAESVWRYFLNGISHVNPFDPYDGVALLYERMRLKKLLQTYIREQKEAQSAPDIVILQWTFALMLLPEVKKAFPGCKTVAVEEDVTFQSYERIWQAKRDDGEGYKEGQKVDGKKGQKIGQKEGRKEGQKVGQKEGYKEGQKVGRNEAQKAGCKVRHRVCNRVLTAFWSHRFHSEKKRELSLLQQTDLIVTNNRKDTELLRKNGIEEGHIFSSVPYFDDYSAVERRPDQQDRTILFYGAMSRAENFESAIWFIEKVMPLLAQEKVRFVVVGANPPERLLRCRSERVEVTGFVQDVRPYFSTCLCMALPLLRGAGIKIKVLEGLSAGIPVLTNEVGIEGIGAAPGTEYLHCTTPEEYAKIVKDLIYGIIPIGFLEKNAREFMEKNYDAGARVQAFIKCVNEL